MELKTPNQKTTEVQKNLKWIFMNLKLNGFKIKPVWPQNEAGALHI